MVEEILTFEQKQALREAMEMIPRLKAEIAKAKQAQIDVTVQEQQLAQLETQIKALYSVYVAPTTTTRTRG